MCHIKEDIVWCNVLPFSEVGRGVSMPLNSRKYHEQLFWVNNQEAWKCQCQYSLSMLCRWSAQSTTNCIFAKSGFFKGYPNWATHVDSFLKWFQEVDPSISLLCQFSFWKGVLGCGSMFIPLVLWDIRDPLTEVRGYCRNKTYFPFVSILIGFD